MNGDLLDQLGRLEGFEATEKFLLENPQLASDFSANYLTIEALNCAMELKVSHFFCYEKVIYLVIICDFFYFIISTVALVAQCFFVFVCLVNWVIIF